MTIKINNDYIKYKMKEQKVPFTELAKKLGCSNHCLYAMLLKDEVPTYLERLVIICNELDISLSDVIQELWRIYDTTIGDIDNLIRTKEVQTNVIIHKETRARRI